MYNIGIEDLAANALKMLNLFQTSQKRTLYLFQECL